MQERASPPHTEGAVRATSTLAAQVTLENCTPETRARDAQRFSSNCADTLPCFTARASAAWSRSF
jgi:hypothetical protein